MPSYYFLERIGWRKQPRQDWPARWMAAGRAVKWKGVCVKRDKNGNVTDDMIAEKRSPIWKALAKGVGGFRDATGSDKPPFAYGSGMGWVAKPLDEKEGKRVVDIESLKQAEIQKVAKQEVDKIMSNLSKHTSHTINIELKF